MSSLLSSFGAVRGMARRAINSTKISSSVNPNPNQRLTVYKTEDWTPPPDMQEIFTTQTPDKRPMRWSKDFKLPRTPDRVSKGEKGIIMRLHHYGCKNRKVYHLVIHKETLPTTKEWEHTQIEQLGTFDPHVNAHGEKLVSLNIERILYWLAQGVKVDVHAGKLLGLAGLTPQQPATYIQAWRNRRDYTRELRIKEEILRERDVENASAEETQS